jgi:hypothetical protein
LSDKAGSRNEGLGGGGSMEARGQGSKGADRREREVEKKPGEKQEKERASERLGDATQLGGE